MSDKSVFSIINFESAPRRVVSNRADTTRSHSRRAAHHAPAAPTTKRRAPQFGAQRAYTAAGAPFERLMALLVAASFAAFAGAFLIGTALEMVGVFIVPGLVVGLGAFIAFRVLDARKQGALRGARGTGAANDPAFRIAAGR